MSFKWAVNWMGRQKWRLILSIVLNIVGVGLMTYEPFIFSDIVDNILMPQEFDRLLPALGYSLFIGSLFMICRYFVSILAEQAAQHAVYQLKGALFDKLLKQTPSFFRGTKVGDLINKCSGDVEVMNRFLCFIIPQAVESALMLAFTLVVFLRINWVYTLILFSITPFTALVASQLGKKVRPAFKAAREQLSDLNTVVQENISGNRVVKAFVREDFEMEKFQKENQAYKDKNIRAMYIWLTYGPIISSLSSLLTVVNLTVGGVMVVLGNITLGQLTVFLSLAWALNEPMEMLGMLVNDYQRFLASIEKVMELYYSPVEIESPEVDQCPEEVSGDIRFEDVSLSFGSTHVLSHINIHITPGETIGIMGPTGSGKTMLVNLINRFVDPTEGAVYIDGVNVKDYALPRLRKNVGMTMQDIFLFSDTVESNIVYGVPDAPMETVIRSAEIADAKGFIEEMPEKYDTIVGERGTGLSGGQKQRISLARALAMNAPILILDDTTSAVDMETEQYIQEQLRALPKKATTIIIAQRISSVMHADHIYILDKGEVLEHGTHQELMKNKGYYYTTCVLQHGLLEEGSEA